MSAITLSQQDTLKLLAAARKLFWWRRRGTFTTKSEERCLSCKCVIYVSFKQFDNASVFCDDPLCRAKANRSSIVQSQYMRTIKERQLKLMESATMKIMGEITEGIEEYKEVAAGQVGKTAAAGPA
jgi:hypothetical protein